ncbi:MAG: hypothetical protein IJX16_03980 [Clostridia bacterium]|nr:hypothetical protein [Clostridia bacterium]
MKITNEKLLKEKENKIKILISHRERPFVETFEFLYKYYTLKHLTGKAPIIFVFEAIYVKNLIMPAWKLANYCNLSRTTLFNYRNEIINNFYTCLEQNVLYAETAITKEN